MQNLAYFSGQSYGNVDVMHGDCSDTVSKLHSLPGPICDLSEFKLFAKLK